MKLRQLLTCLSLTLSVSARKSYSEQSLLGFRSSLLSPALLPRCVCRKQQGDGVENKYRNGSSAVSPARPLKRLRHTGAQHPRHEGRFLGFRMTRLVKAGRAACDIGTLVLFLPVLLSAVAGQNRLRVKTLEYPVNGTLGQSVLLPVEIDHVPKDAEITWRFSGTKPPTSIARHDISESKTKIFPRTQFDGRIEIYENFTLQLNQLREQDEGIYTVTVISSGDHTASVSLLVYKRVSGTKIRSTVTQGNCNATLTCSVTSGDRTSFRWWRGREELGNDSAHRLSGHGEELQIYFASDPKDSVYRCEGRNPVSEETAQIELSDVCNITVPDLPARPVMNSPHIRYIAFVILPIIPFVGALCYYKLRQQSARSEGSPTAENCQNFHCASVLNNYGDSEAPKSPTTIYAEVQNVKKSAGPGRASEA